MKDKVGEEALGPDWNPNALVNAGDRRYLWIDIAHIMDDASYFHLVAKVGESCHRPANVAEERALARRLREDLHEAITKVLADYGVGIVGASRRGSYHRLRRRNSLA